MTDIGMQTRMTPRKLKDHKIRRVRLPFNKGRIAFTSDPGEANEFLIPQYRTRLRAIVRDPEDQILEEHDLGSGVCTAVGVLALAYAGTLGGEGKAKESFDLFSHLKWHQWGTSESSGIQNIKLGSAATNKNTGSAAKAVEATNKVTPSGVGKPKLVSTATIEAESTLEIKEWGIFSQQLLSEEKGTGKFKEGQLSATTAEASGAVLTASTTEVLGERLKVLEAQENSAKEKGSVADEGWALITSNSTTVYTFPAWYKEDTGGAYTPEKTSAYVLRPVMFDHRSFAVINVVSGNKIEFPWELEIEGGH